MAQKVQVLLTDDLDGKDADETVTFSLDGITWEIDLSKKNAQAMRDTFGKYMEAGRKVSGSRTRRSSTKRTQDFDPKAVRAWAASNGVDVSPRGRISEEVLTQFRAAGN